MSSPLRIDKGDEQRSFTSGEDEGKGSVSTQEVLRSKESTVVNGQSPILTESGKSAESTELDVSTQTTESIVLHMSRDDKIKLAKLTAEVEQRIRRRKELEAELAQKEHENASILTAITLEKAVQAYQGSQLQQSDRNRGEEEGAVEALVWKFVAGRVYMTHLADIRKHKETQTRDPQVDLADLSDLIDRSLRAPSLLSLMGDYMSQYKMKEKKTGGDSVDDADGGDGSGGDGNGDAL